MSCERWPRTPCRADLEPLRKLLRARQQSARAAMEVTISSDLARMLRADIDGDP